MDLLPFALVLASAIMHASWNAVVKSGNDGLTRLSIIHIACAIFALPVLPFVKFPAAESWNFLALSAVIHTAYYTLLIQSYRFGDLSHAYPLARGSAPILVAIMSFIFAGEILPPFGIAAVLIICLAILSLAFHGRPNPKGTIFALLTGVSIASYTVVDGLGARASGDAVGYIMVLYILEALPIGFYALAKRRLVLAQAIIHNWRPSLSAGFFAFLGYAIVVWATTQAPITFVSALRETSVVVAALIGSRLLREPFGIGRMAAACAVAAGVMLLHVAPKL